MRASRKACKALSLGGLEIRRGDHGHMVTGRIIRVLLLSSAATQNPMRKSVRYGSGVGDNEPVTWSHAGNTLSPVPLSPSFLSPLVRPASFLRSIHGKKRLRTRGFLLTIFGGGPEPRKSLLLQHLGPESILGLPKRNQRNHLRFAEFCPLTIYEQQTTHNHLCWCPHPRL